MSGKGLEALRERFAPVPAEHWMAGISGGADSTALLLLLKEYKEAGAEIEAVHVNHGLRGEASDADEAFVRDLCRKEGIPCTVYRADLGGKRDENSAREARWRFFREHAERTGAKGVILAHNRDDLAETFLMRLLRGAGGQGLACMTEADERDGLTLLRPLLRTGRTEIREALRADGISWREDESNRDSAYLRNRVRNEWLPLMAETAPHAAEHIAAAASLIAEDNEALTAQAEALLAGNAEGSLLRTEALKQLPAALQKRTVRLWWRKNGPALKERELGLDVTEQLTVLMDRPGESMNLPGNYRAFCGRQGLYLLGGETPERAETPVTFPETDFGEIRLTAGPSEGNPGDGKRCQEVPEAFLKGCTVRTRRDGDRIRPFGAGGSRKLQDYLTDRKVDRPWRDRIPLVCRGQEVLLVCGIGAGNVPRFDPEANNVRLTWQGNLPWAGEEG